MNALLEPPLLDEAWERVCRRYEMTSMRQRLAYLHYVMEKGAGIKSAEHVLDRLARKFLESTGN